MFDKYKKYLYIYFSIGYFWAIFAGFVQLIYFEDVSFWLYMFTFLVNIVMWPISMLIAL